MELIKYEEYLNALSIVNRFQTQILSKHEKVEMIVNNSCGTILLSDFLADNVVNPRIITAVKGMSYFDMRWSNGIDFNKCTVEYFLECFLREVEKSRRVKIIRNISQSTIIELLSIFESKGFDVAEFKYYY